MKMSASSLMQPLFYHVLSYVGLQRDLVSNSNGGVEPKASQYAVMSQGLRLGEEILRYLFVAGNDLENFVKVLSSKLQPEPEYSLQYVNKKLRNSCSVGFDFFVFRTIMADAASYTSQELRHLNGFCHAGVISDAQRNATICHIQSQLESIQIEI